MTAKNKATSEVVKEVEYDDGDVRFERRSTAFDTIYLDGVPAEPRDVVVAWMSREEFDATFEVIG